MIGEIEMLHSSENSEYIAYLQDAHFEKKAIPLSLGTYYFGDVYVDSWVAEKELNFEVVFKFSFVRPTK